MDINPISTHALFALTPVDVHRGPNEEGANGNIFCAIEQRDMGAFSAMLEDPTVDLNVNNDSAQNPLHFAISIGHNEAALALIERCGGDPTVVNALDRYGYTPLMRASDTNNIAVMSALISVRAAISSGHNVNCTPSMLVAKKTAISKAFMLQDAKGDVFAALLIAAVRGNIAAAKSFIAAGANSSAALCAVSTNGSVQEAAVLIAAGADPSHALMMSVFGPLGSAKNRAKAVRVLLSLGADLSTALAHAMAGNQLVAARVLLFLGANDSHALASSVRDLDAKGAALLSDAKVDASTTLVRLAGQNDTDSLKFMIAGADRAKALVDAICHAHIGAARGLIKHGTDMSAALMYAIAANQKGAAQILILLGAELSVALMHAIKNDQPKAADVLIGIGADYAHALMYAAAGGESKVAVLCMQQGANHTTALKIAAVTGNAKAARFLLANGANMRLALADVAAQDGLTAVRTILAADVDASLVLLQPAVSGWPDAVHELITRRADLSVALAYAIRDADVAAITALLLLGADGAVALKSAIDIGKHDAARLLLRSGLDLLVVIRQAAKRGHLRVAEWLVRETPDVCAVMRQLVQCEDVPAVKLWVAASGSAHTVELLHEVAKAGDINAAKLLIGLEPDSVIALMDAVITHDIRTAAVLIAAGADISMTLRATARRRFAQTKAFLDDAKREASVLSPGMTSQLPTTPSMDAAAALGAAISMGHVVAVRELISSGTDATAAMKDAVSRHLMANPAVFRLFGADLSAVLIHAAAIHNKKAVEQLIGMGVDVSGAMRHADEHGDWNALDLLMAVSVAQKAPI